MEYSMDFSNRLIESAELLFKNSPEKKEANRTILYLSCVSCEISLKVLLEETGYSQKELKSFGHGLSNLLDEVASCVFKKYPYPTNVANRKASGIRSKVVIENTANGTVGTLLKLHSGASVHPNQIRYGQNVRHFPPSDMLACAKVVSEWCDKHKDNLKRTNCP